MWIGEVIMLQCLKVMGLWLICFGYSVIALFGLISIYIRNIRSKPWIPKERPNIPACLINPKYGAHKFVTLNVIKQMNKMILEWIFKNSMCFVRRVSGCIMSNLVIRLNRWCYSFTDSQVTFYLNIWQLIEGNIVYLGRSPLICAVTISAKNHLANKTI